MPLIPHCVILPASLLTLTDHLKSDWNRQLVNVAEMCNVRNCWMWILNNRSSLCFVVCQCKMQDHVLSVERFHSALAIQTSWLASAEKSLRAFKVLSKLLDGVNAQMSSFKVCITLLRPLAGADRRICCCKKVAVNRLAS